jgi:hypothetical protein
MYYEVFYASRTRYEELLKQAEQEHLARRLHGQQPSALRRVLGRAVADLGSRLVEWGTVHQPHHSPALAPATVKGHQSYAHRS